MRHAARQLPSWLIFDVRHKKMIIKRKDTSQLVALLFEAAARFRALGNRPIWSSYADGPAVAAFLERSATEIDQRKISQESANELWGIFAPTSDWDDCVGDVELGERVFGAIDEVIHYQDKKPNKAPEPTPGAVTPRATEGTSK